MFRMSGKKVELYRYTVTYTENEIEMIENCISKDHKNEVENDLRKQGISFSTKEVDQTGNEWFNGLKFSSYDEALIAFNGGEQTYKSTLTTDERIEALETQTADIAEAFVNLQSENALKEIKNV